MFAKLYLLNIDLNVRLKPGVQCYFECFVVLSLPVIFYCRATVQTVRNIFSVENGYRLCDDQ